MVSENLQSKFFWIYHKKAAVGRQKQNANGFQIYHLFELAKNLNLLGGDFSKSSTC